MDEIQEAFAAFISREVKENANPYPTAIQAFRAGVDAENERILSVLRRIVETRKNTTHHQGGPYSVNFALIELERIIGKDDK